MTGDRLASEILKIRPNVPIVICTGYSKMINEKDALKLGASALLYKPLNRSELLKAIQKALKENKSNA